MTDRVLVDPRAIEGGLVFRVPIGTKRGRGRVTLQSKRREEDAHTGDRPLSGHEHQRSDHRYVPSSYQTTTVHQNSLSQSRMPQRASQASRRAGLRGDAVNMAKKLSRGCGCAVPGVGGRYGCRNRWSRQCAWNAGEKKEQEGGAGSGLEAGRAYLALDDVVPSRRRPPAAGRSLSLSDASARRSHASLLAALAAHLVSVVHRRVLGKKEQYYVAGSVQRMGPCARKLIL